MMNTELKCDPTLTVCPRCNNDVSLCDGVFHAPKDESKVITESPEAVQWRNIKHVVKTLADWGFGDKEDPQWGVAWICMVNGITAKDGPEFKLEALPMSKEVAKRIEELEARVAELTSKIESEAYLFRKDGRIS